MHRGDSTRCNHRHKIPPCAVLVPPGITAPDGSAVRERECLQPPAEAKIDESVLHKIVGNYLLQRRWTVDRRHRGLPTAGHAYRAGAPDDQIDVLGVVVQFDAGVIGFCSGPLIVERPCAA